MMLTRCPTCSTAFRVTPEQLKARAGKVRCGHCKAVFNALESLEDAPPVAEAAPPPPSASEPVPAAAAEETPAVESSPAEAATPDSAPPEPSAVEAGADTVGAGAVDILLEDIETTEVPPPAPRRGWYAWAAAGVLALALLLAQAVYVFRAELALSQPDWRPQLEELCSQLGCDIPLPRKTDLVSIEASDLHPEPQRKNLLVLSATLKNRAPFVQEYPHLEVTLTDTRDQPMVRRVFAPAEYLAEGANVRAGFAANGDLAVNLWLDTGNVGASGYRLYLFYP
ncbi:MAG: hypothetical protein BroJett006_05620 [Betaproteobacteria bacterium]|nr:MAG: hypothetical protein BroJett006_05620 [Betaproteobacteria bacterium]